MTMHSNMGQIAQGAVVYGSNNEKIGQIAEVGQDHLLVQKGMLFHKDMYVPMSAVSRVDGKHVYLNLSKEQVNQMAAENLPARGDAWYGTTTTGTTMTAANTTGTARTGGETVSVPVIEEELRADVREVSGGGARIVKDVVSEQQSIDVPVKHEEVYVTERAVNRPATQADMAAMNRDTETIDIPLTEQQVVTSKEAVVTGEVGIRKQVTTETQRVSDTVRREEVHMEDADSARVHVEGDMNPRTNPNPNPNTRR